MFLLGKQPHPPFHDIHIARGTLHIEERNHQLTGHYFISIDQFDYLTVPFQLERFPLCHL
jgi:hypothetical protein